MKVRVERVNGKFRTKGISENGSEVFMDAGKAFGGNDEGASPKELLLMAIGGCSTIDVTDFLAERGATATAINVDVTAVREKDVVPSLFESINVHYQLEGEISDELAMEVVELSINKYCSIARLLRTVATVDHQLSVNGVLVDHATVNV